MTDDPADTPDFDDESATTDSVEREGNEEERSRGYGADSAELGDGDGVGSGRDGVAGDVAAEADTAANAESDARGETGERPTESEIPEDVRKYERFKKMDGSQYERVNSFLRDRTYVTAREWAIARLCADFRTETGVEMTKIGNNLPRLIPFMTDTYTPQAVNQARASFEGKVKKSGSTFLYGAMCGFFTAEELDEMMYEVTEIAKFLLEVEGVDISVDEELAAEERISSVMREVRQESAQLRGEEVECPECGHVHEP